jgi:hypothetical protein
MSNGPATGIVLTAGAVTFTSEWYWNKQIDWKVPLATVLLAAAFEGLSAIDKNGATLLSIMVFAGAASTKFGGHSAFDMVTTLVGGGKTTVKPAKQGTTTNPATGGTTPPSTTSAAL